jgi:large subunit ribosomal protein L21
MYAVIKTGGKQHKVKPGDVLEVELIHSDDDTVTFTPLLVVDDDGGTHFGKDASRAKVTAKLVGEQKGDKVKVFKYRQKTGYSRRAGHRQMYTLIEIQDVSLPGTRSRASTSAKKAEPTKAGDEKATAKKSAAKQPADAKPVGTKPAEDIGAVTEAESPEAADVPTDRVEDAADAGGPEA